MSLRLQGGTWRLYLTHCSNAWVDPGSPAYGFPLKASEQTYRSVREILRASERMSLPKERLAITFRSVAPPRRRGYRGASPPRGHRRPSGGYSPVATARQFLRRGSSMWA